MSKMLPDLRWTPETKVGAEALVFINKGPGYKLGTLVKGASGSVYMPAASCARQVVSPIVGGFIAAGLQVLNRADVAVVGGHNTIVLPVTSPLGTAFELQQDIDPTSLTISGSQVGDQAEVLALPDPANDILICYDQGIDIKTGETWKPIPRKFDTVDHYVRQRAENSISLKDLFVCNVEGLRGIAGTIVTVIVKIMPSGGNVPSEIQYYTNCRFNVPPIMSGGDANASIELGGDSKFQDYAVFSAPQGF